MVLRRSYIRTTSKMALWVGGSFTETHIISLLINDDIDAIIQRGEERTSVLNSKYQELNFEDLNNFKSDASVQQWEGEDFRTGVRCVFILLFFVVSELSFTNRRRTSTLVSCPCQSERESPTTPSIATLRILSEPDRQRWTKDPSYPKPPSK